MQTVLVFTVESGVTVPLGALLDAGSRHVDVHEVLTSPIYLTRSALVFLASGTPDA